VRTYVLFNAAVECRWYAIIRGGSYLRNAVALVATAGAGIIRRFLCETNSLASVLTILCQDLENREGTCERGIRYVMFVFFYKNIQEASILFRL